MTGSHHSERRRDFPRCVLLELGVIAGSLSRKGTTLVNNESKGCSCGVWRERESGLEPLCHHHLFAISRELASARPKRSFSPKSFEKGRTRDLGNFVQSISYVGYTSSHRLNGTYTWDAAFEHVEGPERQRVAVFGERLREFAGRRRERWRERKRERERDMECTLRTSLR